MSFKSVTLQFDKDILEVPLLAVTMRILGCDSSKHDTSVPAVLYHWLYTPET